MLSNIISGFKTVAVDQTHTRCVLIPDSVIFTVLCKYFELSPEEVEFKTQLFTSVQGSLIDHLHIQFHSIFPPLNLIFNLNRALTQSLPSSN
jgi:hypothetical protein